MTRFLHPIVPDRPAKPRSRGLTHAVDHLVGIQDVHAPQILEFVDVVKIGWGLPALLTPVDIKRRIAAYHHQDVQVSSGGTLTEYAMLKRAFEPYLGQLAQAGFDIVELSESRLNLSASEKGRALAQARQHGLEVAIKVGRKNPREQLNPQELKRKLEEAAALEAWKVVIEAGEGLGVALFGTDGQLREEALDLVCSTFGPERVIFEAPLRHQRGALIFRLGPEVNIGGVPLGEVPTLETQRLGVMSGETFGLVRVTGGIPGGPAAKFVHFLITTRSPVSQEEIIRISGLPRRTVQAALERLRGGGLIMEEPDLEDLRRKLYRPAPRV